MSDAARDPLKDIYNDVNRNHEEGQTYVHSTPDALLDNDADSYIVKTHAPAVWDALSKYETTSEELASIQEELNERATAAAAELPEQLREDGRARPAYEQDDRGYEPSVSPTTFFIQAYPALTNDASDLSTHLEEHFTRFDNQEGEDLVESWEERYPDWDEAVREAANAYRIVEAIDDLYDLNEQLESDAEELKAEIEDELAPEQGLVDRLLRR